MTIVIGNTDIDQLINSEYSIDFSESIPKMVQRLKAEHRDFRIELIKIEDVSEVSSRKAIEMLKELKKPIILHTVEE